MTNTICIYHENCADGFGAAWAVHRLLGIDQNYYKREGRLTFVPSQYGRVPLDVDGQHVLIVDFSYKHDVLLALAEKAASVLVIDHHKSAIEELSGYFDEVAPGKYDKFKNYVQHGLCLQPTKHAAIAAKIGLYLSPFKSGAALTWEMFDGGPLPRLLAYVQDYDLWRKELPDSDAVNAYIKAEALISLRGAKWLS